MADVNYVNPSAMNPGQDWKPAGFLGGMYYNQQKRQYDDMQGLQQAMTMMQAQKQGGELEDYQSARPSALASTIATNTATANTVGRLKESEASQQESKARLDKDTLLSNIETKISSNDQSVRDNALKGVEHAMQVLDLMGPAVKSGNKDAVKRILEQSKVKPDNPVVQDIMDHPDPGSRWQEYMDSFEGMASRRKAGEIKLKGGFDIQERKIMAEASNYAADKHLEAAQYRTEHQKHTDKLEGLLSRSMEAYYAETDPVKKQQLARKVDEIEKMTNTLKSLGAPYGSSEFRSDVIGGRTTNPAGAPSARATSILPFSQRAGESQPGSPTENNLKGLVELQGEPYQPDKYEYKVSADGSVLKRKK